MPLQTHQIPEETAAIVSPSPARLSDTAEAVSPLPKGAVTEALEAAENAEQKRRAVFGIYHTVSIAIALLFVSSLIAMFASAMFHFTPDIHKKIMYFWAATFTLNVLCTFSTTRQWVARYDRAVYEAAIKLLPATNDPGRLLPFVDSLRAHKTPDERRQLYPALTELLWNLPAADATLLLDATRRTALRNAVTGSYTIMANFRRQASDGHFDDATADLAVAIMKTLASIGDKKSVKPLQKIINADAKTPNDTVVRDAAREYLPVLKQQIAENNGVQKKLTACLEEKIRAPQKVLVEFLDTLSPQNAKTALVENLQRRRQKATQSLPLLVINLVAMYFPLYFGLSYNPALRLAVLCLYTFAAIPLLFFHLAYSMRDDEQWVVYELAQHSETDTRLLAFLLYAARHRLNPQVADTVTKAVARLLPLLQPSDAALVPPAQRAYLRSWLKLPRRKTKRGNSGSKGNNSQTLAILALNALAAIGDTKALPAAEAIARRTTRGNYHEADLHEAALRCVDALRMRKG